MTFLNNSVNAASGWNKQNIYLSIYLSTALHYYGDWYPWQSFSSNFTVMSRAVTEQIVTQSRRLVTWDQALIFFFASLLLWLLPKADYRDKERGHDRRLPAGSVGTKMHQEDPRRWNSFSLGLHRAQNFGSCGCQVEKEVKMAGDNHKNAIWALRLSQLATSQRGRS